MRWHSWLYILLTELFSAALSAVVGLLTNVLAGEKHIETIVIVSLISFVILSAILQTVRNAIAETRSRTNHKTLQGIQEDTHQILSNQQGATDERAQQRIDVILVRFPELFRSWIKTQWIEDSDGVKRILDALNEPTASPSAVVQEWQMRLPDWFGDLGWRALLVAGELANAYSAGKLSAELFLAAIDAGATRQQYWAARAALLWKFQEETEKARELLVTGGVGSESQDQFARIVFAFVADDRQSAQTLLDAWTPEVPIDILWAANIRVTLILAGSDGTTQPGTGLGRVAAIYRNTIEAIPYSASSRLGVAHALISAVALGASTSRHRDLQEALDQALRARNISRSIRAPSISAVETACQAAYSDMQYSRVIQIGTTVTGEATLEEANSDVVKTLVASSAIAKGQLDMSNRLISEIADPFRKAFLFAMSAEVAGHPSAELWHAAMDQARDVSDRARVLLGFARMGITELPGLDEIRISSPRDAVLIQAVAAVASGSVDSAIQQLRAMSGMDIGMVMTLVDAYLEVNNITAASDVLREAARALGEPRLRVEAARLLWQDDRTDDARIELEGLLIDSGSDESLRHDCLALLGQWAADQNQWAKSQERFQQLLALDPHDSQARWAVILVMLRRGLISEACQIYDSAPTEPTIVYPDHARAWMAVKAHAERPDGAAFVEGIINVAQRFPDNENVQAEAIFAILSPVEADRGPLPPATQARFNDLCDRFFRTWPESSRLRRYSASDVQALVSQMEELVRPTQEQKTLRIEIAAQLAQNTLPWAFLSALTGRTYAEIVVVRAGGVLPARHIDSAEQQMCREAAQAALDKSVVLDISAAAVITELVTLGNLLIGQFERLIVSEDERLDANQAREFLRARSTSSWIYDEQSDRGRLVDISLEEANERYDKADKLSNLISECRVVPVANDPRFSELRDLARSSWATTVLCAAQTGTAFWCDDVALRAVARSIGVPAFSTPALLEILSEPGVLTADQRESAVRVLIQSLVGDFPLDQMRLSVLTAQSGRGAGPVASIFSRTASWVDVPNTYRIWVELVGQVAAVNSRYASDWLYAAIIGITRPQRDPNIRREAAALLLTGAASLVGDDSEAVARCVAAARAGLSVVRHEDADDDPLGRAAQMIRASISQQAGLTHATTYVSGMFSGLEAGDRYKVLQALYG